MIIKKLLFLTLLACCICAQAQIDNRSDWKKQDLKGAVKTLTTYRLHKPTLITQAELEELKKRGNNGEIWRKELDVTLEFDKAGYITKSIAPKESFSQSYDITYRPDHQILRQTFYDASGNKKNIYDFEYDNEGHPIRAIKKSDTEFIFEENYVYNEAGLLSSMIHNIGNKKKVTHTFNYKDNKLTRWEISEDGVTNRILCFNPGDPYNPTEISQLYRNNMVRNRMIYNEKNQGVQIMQELNDGQWFLFIKRTFDTNDNITQEIQYQEDGSIKSTRTISYKYDRYGNWIRKETKGTQPHQNYIEEREITYY